MTLGSSLLDGSHPRTGKWNIRFSANRASLGAHAPRGVEASQTHLRGLTLIFSSAIPIPHRPLPAKRRLLANARRGKRPGSSRPCEAQSPAGTAESPFSPTFAQITNSAADVLQQTQPPARPDRKTPPPPTRRTGRGDSALCVDWLS